MELLRYWAIIYFWLVTAAVIFVSKVVSGVQPSVEVTPHWLYWTCHPGIEAMSPPAPPPTIQLSQQHGREDGGQTNDLEEIKGLE